MFGFLLQAAGLLASVGSLVWLVIQLRERRIARLFVHFWWEETLSPTQRKRFRRDASIGMLDAWDIVDFKLRWYEYNFSAKGWIDPLKERLRIDLYKPPKPLNVRRARGDGLWALRLLIYNPSGDVVEPSDVDAIAVTVLTPGGVMPLSWQASDGRLELVSRNEDPQTETTEFRLQLGNPLRPRRKVRDDLAVLYNSGYVHDFPEASVSVSTHLKHEIKPYRPADNYREVVARQVDRHYLAVQVVEFIALLALIYLGYRVLLDM